MQEMEIQIRKWTQAVVLRKAEVQLHNATQEQEERMGKWMQVVVQEQVAAVMRLRSVVEAGVMHAHTREEVRKQAHAVEALRKGAVVREVMQVVAHMQVVVEDIDKENEN